MNRLIRVLISLWKIEQLERRVAILESELTLRVAKLEGDATAIEYNRARAKRLFDNEPKAKNTDKRFEQALDALTLDLKTTRIFQEMDRTPFWKTSGMNQQTHSKQL